MSEHIIKRANGKLLLTGEYAVLDGAMALGLPTKYGQTIAVIKEDTPQDKLKWESLDMYHDIWFEGTFNTQTFNFSESDNNDSAEVITRILNYVAQQNPDSLSYISKIRIKLDYPVKWGLGSSASVISCIAQVFEVDPYQIQKDVFGGSGYDIACATSNKPILYTNNIEAEKKVTPSSFRPVKPELWHFVYLGHKKNSREAIKYYKDIVQDKSQFVSTINQLSLDISASKSHSEQVAILNKHEDVVSEFLNLPKAKTQHFEDFDGVIKSLGAWGGDFVAAVSKDKNIDLDYFYQKGYPTVIPYTSIIMN